MPETTDFYEDDEPVVKIRAAWDAARMLIRDIYEQAQSTQDNYITAEPAELAWANGLIDQIDASHLLDGEGQQHA